MTIQYLRPDIDQVYSNWPASRYWPSLHVVNDLCLYIDLVYIEVTVLRLDIDPVYV